MVVIAFSVSDLEKQVNEFIRIGWKPIGGVTIDKDTYDNGEINNLYLQAMVHP